jgi:O-antigen ligase
MIAIGVPVFALLLALVPNSITHRLVMLVSNPEEQMFEVQGADVGDVMSQYERQQLLKESLWYTIKNPVFGVGPGQFNTAHLEDSKKVGKHIVDLGTHNTYTQISSETGVPGGVAYLFAVFLSVVANYRMYRMASARPGHKTLANMALAMFFCTVCWSVNAFFHHLGYTWFAAELIGITVALWLAGMRSLTPSTN